MNEYIKIYIFTLKKVDVFANIFNITINNTLKVNLKWNEIYVVYVQCSLKLLQRYIMQPTYTIILMIICIVISKIFGKC